VATPNLKKLFLPKKDVIKIWQGKVLSWMKRKGKKMQHWSSASFRDCLLKSYQNLGAFIM
ncbi:hypothetical protein HN51_046760, partial [Arachis hypogaea]